MKFLSLFIFIAFTHKAFAQVTFLKATNKSMSIRIGNKWYENAWKAKSNTINNPESIGTEVGVKGEKFVLVSNVDSIAFTLKQGQSKLFAIVVNNTDTSYTIIKAKYTKANFTEAYKKANNNKVLVELPEVYELVNIIMAITPTGKADSNLIEHQQQYYAKVQQYFSKYASHKAVIVMDSLLQAGKYFDIKMDSYSYHFVKSNLQKKENYHRISWGENNTIDEYIPLIKSFSTVSNFKQFYSSNTAFYKGMVKAYEDTLGIPSMMRWLQKNFPAQQYNCVKIIFSPLVNGNQSATFFNDNNFKETQAHVNFPSFWYNAATSKYTEKSFNVTRGNIVFTELNHAFENPLFETDSLYDKLTAFKFNLYHFIDTNKTARNYNNALSCVEEYMNWALVGLRYIDEASEKDLSLLQQRLVERMEKGRGFTQFGAFYKFLATSYLAKSKDEVVANLFGSCIEWFKENSKQ